MRLQLAMAAAAVAGSTTNQAMAIPVTVTASSSLFQFEAQGFAGRMLFQGPVSGIGFTGVSGLNGIASDGQFAFFSGSTSPSFTQIRKVDILANTSPTTINVARGLSDIAVSNGQLYGIVDQASSANLEIVRIAADGSLTTVVSQTNVAPTNGKWRLSGVVGGDQLIAIKGRTIFGPPPATARTAFAFTASTGASAFSLAPSSTPALAAGQVGETVIESGGQAITFIPVSQSSDVQQPRFSLPGGSALGVRASADRFGNSVGSGAVSSDEFNIAFPSSSPAQASTSLSTSSTAFGKLYRAPFLWSGAVTVGISNGVAPDGVTLTSVASATPVVQSAGPTPMTFVNVNATAPGSFSARTYGGATAQLDLATALGGIYTVSSGPLTGTYNGEAGRAITTAVRGVRSFAYEPISTNIVGNGAIELNAYGWDDVSSPTFQFAASNISDLGDHSLWITPGTNSPVSVRQIIELPMSTGAMQFGFDYRVDDFPTLTTPITITATLGGTQIASFSVAASMDDYAHFGQLIDIPALYGLSNVELRFTITGATWTYLDNISLVPEPTTVSLLLTGGLALRRRPRRRVHCGIAQN